MPPKLAPPKPTTPKPSRSDWKTAEQLEFLVNRWEGFKRAQDGKTLDHFWARVFEDWYTFWPIPSSPSLARDYGTIEEGRLMLQKEKNNQIKQWFNNRCRSGTDSAKGSRGDLKLDVNGKRKLAAVQAYCSYAWESSLRSEVLTRWKQEKSTTLDDDDDPPEEDEGSSEESSIPLAFKLKIAKELYEKLSPGEKSEIDRRREEDRDKRYRKIPDIADDEERYQKLRTHERNQPLAVKALTRVLANLEDQTGCVAHLFIASVNPTGGVPKIQKFCQGVTPRGLKFETFYGDEWEESVENKFREWALRVFGEKGSDRRNLFLLPKNPEAPSEASSSQDLSTEASASQGPPTLTASSQKPTPRPSRPRKPVPQPPTSKKPMPQTFAAGISSPMSTPAPPAAIISDLPQSTSTPTPDLPVPHASVNPPVGTPNPDTDVALFATAIGVHQLLSQAATVPQVVQGPLAATSASPNIIEPPQLTVNPSQLIITPSQVTIKPSQPVSERSKASTGVVPVDTQADSAVVPIPLSQPATKATDTTSNDAAPKVLYRIRNPAAKPSRRSSIDGAPEIVEVADEEITVDLRDYISTESDDAMSRVSSSQKSADGCRDLLSPPRDSQLTNAGTTEGNTAQSALASSRTLPHLDIDEDDLPTWMVKKGQWRYVASTAGGTEWEHLLKLYMSQERRLEFTDTGTALPSEDRPSKVKEYFQYAHQPSRGDTLTFSDFGPEVAKWWGRLQPEWRRSGRDLPQSTSQWSYILSGGSKGAFLVILCLAWWDRAYGRHLEEKRKACRVGAEAAEVTMISQDLPDHDAQWLTIVNDVAFVMRNARDCDIPGREMPSTSRKGKRKRQDEAAPQQMSATKRSSRKRSKV